MITRTLRRRLTHLEARRPAITHPEDFHTILFIGAKDEAATLTLQFGPKGSQTWTDLADPTLPARWTDTQ